MSIKSQYFEPFKRAENIKSNTWNYLIVGKQMSSGSFKNNVTYKLFT